MKTKKIYISVSDFGCGFGNTIKNINSYIDEIEAILLGVYKRKDSKWRFKFKCYIYS